VAATKFDGSKKEAQFLLRLVQAYQAAQDTVFKLGFLLDEFDLRKGDSEDVDVDRVLALAERAKAAG
jgi:hypothetical protein